MTSRIIKKNTAFKKKIKGLIKIAGIQVCISLGSIVRPTGVPVLGYHSIAESNLNLSTLPYMFSVQMDYLHTQGYLVVSLKEYMIAIQPRAALLNKIVVLTFDDGLEDFYKFAWPILDRYNFSATVFVPTDYIGKTSKWYADYGLSPQPMMNWHQLREVTTAGMDIQSHGCSHLPLTVMPARTLQKEMVESKEILEQGLGLPVDYFCCPQGLANYEVKAAIKNAEYRGATIGGHGLHQVGDDPYSINRQFPDTIDISDKKTALLNIKACLQGTFVWYVNARNVIQ